VYLKLYNFTSKDIQKLLVLKTWYASIFVLPVANKLILYFTNNKKLTPNQITSIALILRFMTMLLFFNDYFIIGAISYYIAYVLDCVDGPVARLTDQTSEFGRYFDHISDLVGDILILCALAYSQGLFLSPIILSMIFMHVAESYISFITGFAIKNNEKKSNFFLFRVFNNYRNWWFSRNFKSFLSFPDYTAFIFILMPILNRPKKGIEIGFYLLIIIVCYTILSTFVSIFTGEKRFP
jgi:phosphatidylglycerophosphate synthase